MEGEAPWQSVTGRAATTCMCEVSLVEGTDLLSCLHVKKGQAAAACQKISSGATHLVAHGPDNLTLQHWVALIKSHAEPLTHRQGHYIAGEVAIGRTQVFGHLLVQLHASGASLPSAGYAQFAGGSNKHRHAQELATQRFPA